MLENILDGCSKDEDKACGEDGIHAQIFKNAEIGVLIIFANFFN